MIISCMTTIILDSCKSKCNCESIIRTTPDGETLYGICKYLQDNNSIAEPADPCKWTIQERKEIYLDGKQVIKISLSCCYMGDEIIIDKETNRIIRYRPSPK